AALAPSATAAAVSPTLLTSTLEAASLYAAGTATAGLSGPVVALTEGVLKTMLMTKIKTAGTLVLLVGLGFTLGGLGYTTFAAAGAAPVPGLVAPAPLPPTTPAPEGTGLAPTGEGFPVQDNAALKDELRKLAKQQAELRDQIEKLKRGTADNKAAADENAKLRAEIDAARKRIADLEQELKKLQKGQASGAEIEKAMRDYLNSRANKDAEGERKAL